MREKRIHIVKIGTATNRADLQTKALEPARHAALVGLLPVKRSKTVGCSTSSVGSFVAALFLRPSCGEAQHVVVHEGSPLTDLAAPDANWALLRICAFLLALMIGWQLHRSWCFLVRWLEGPATATTSRHTQTTRVERIWWWERSAEELRAAARERGLDSGRVKAELIRSLVEFEANAV